MEPLDYGTPEINREADRRHMWRRIFSHQNLSRLLLAVVLIAGCFWLVRWQASLPRDWDIRPVPLDGRDIAIAMGLQIHKVQMKLPPGKWAVSVHLASYLKDSSVANTSRGSTFGGIAEGTHTLLFYIPEDSAEPAQVSLGGITSRLAQPVPVSVGYDGTRGSGFNSSGRLTPLVPFVLWYRVRDSNNVGMRPVPNPGEHDQMIALTVTISPYTQSFSPSTSPAPIPVR